MSPSDNKAVLFCPSCSRMMRVPTDCGPLVVTCPRCRHRFDWGPPAHTDEPGSHGGGMTPSDPPQEPQPASTDEPDSRGGFSDLIMETVIGNLWLCMGLAVGVVLFGSY